VAGKTGFPEIEESKYGRASVYVCQ